MPKRRTPRAVSRAEFIRLGREVARMRHVLEQNARLLESLQKDCAMNLRRCGELQRDFDALRKLLSRF